MNTPERFLLAMLVIYTLPWAVWRFARTESFAPLVVVQIVGGIVLGPGLLGAAWPSAYAALFTPEVVHTLNGVAWWAVMLFVFVAGLELDLGAAWRHRGETALTAALAMLLPFVLGAGAGALMLASGGAWRGAGASPWQFVAGVGMASAVTALPILVLLMDKLRILRSALGQRILRYASLDDILIWAVLALVLLDTARLARQGLFVVLLIAAALGLRRLVPRLAPADRWAVALVWLIVVAFGADWSGLHFMVGAFLAGAALDGRWFGRQRVDRLRETVLLLLMPVFFLSTGLRTQWAMGGLAVFAAAGLLLAASVAGKLAGAQLAGRLLGWRPGEAGIIGWLLQTKALIMIIFANVLLDRGVISADAFTALLLMAVASTMLTVPMVAPRLARLANTAPAEVSTGAAGASPEHADVTRA